MVPYFGRHNCKMYIRGKPIRFGFKFWCMCSDSRYIYEASPYAGIASPYNKQVGLGATVVLDILKYVTVPKHHGIYFDNFFSSYYLFSLLNENKFRAIEAVTRLKGADSHLASVKKSKKKIVSKLQKHVYYYVFDTKNKQFFGRWHDNLIVVVTITIISNFVGAQPESRVSRYSSQEKKKKISITQPMITNKCNKHMGGVDLHDNGVTNYRISTKRKIWWWQLWTNCINSAIVNT